MRIGYDNKFRRRDTVLSIKRITGYFVLSVIGLAMLGATLFMYSIIEGSLIEGTLWFAGGFLSMVVVQFLIIWALKAIRK